MTLARRIIPSMLVRGRTLVKGQRFESWRSIGHAAQAARIHGARAVDELFLADIGATAEGRGPDLSLIEELSDAVFIPITVAGGVRSLADIDALLRAGADKVCIGTGAVEVPGLIEQAADRFGSQAITVAVDVGADGMVRSNCGKTRLPRLAVHWAQQMAELGAGEILLTSIERDGTLTGYDIELIREVAAAIDVPLIAAGGCSGPDDMLKAFQAGADACAAGALYAFTEATPASVARSLRKAGLCVRV